MALREIDHLLLGGGGASAAAAETLRLEGATGSIMILSAESQAPYYRPALSKEVLLGTAVAQRALHPPSFYLEQAVELGLDTEVAAVDAARQTVTTRAGEQFRYGHLLIATGSRPIALQVPGAALAGVHYLRNSVDCDALRRAIARRPSGRRQGKSRKRRGAGTARRRARRQLHGHGDRDVADRAGAARDRRRAGSGDPAASRSAAPVRSLPAARREPGSAGAAFGHHRGAPRSGPGARGRDRVGSALALRPARGQHRGDARHRLPRRQRHCAGAGPRGGGRLDARQRPQRLCRRRRDAVRRPRVRPAAPRRALGQRHPAGPPRRPQHARPARAQRRGVVLLLRHRRCQLQPHGRARRCRRAHRPGLARAGLVRRAVPQGAMSCGRCSRWAAPPTRRATPRA